MAKVLITGSADGLGQIAAKQLVELGHQVLLHARNEKRAKDAQQKIPQAEKVFVADLSSMQETKRMAEQVNKWGSCDAVIHNAGIYTGTAKTGEGVPVLLAVNVLAPYILTCMMNRPERLVYMSSAMHTGGDASLKVLQKTEQIGSPTYSDTKLYDLILALAVARKWTGVYSNAVNPGWVPTKMGGAGAPDDLEKGAETQAWLAVSHDNQARVSGHYFFHKGESQYLSAAGDHGVQEKLLAVCAKLSGIPFPVE